MSGTHDDAPEVTPPESLPVLDEVVEGLGEESDGRGILDRWQTTAGALTGALEGTWPGGGPPTDEEPAHMQLLGAIMSSQRELDPLRFGGLEGQPCEEIKVLIADEPLDPVPLPDGVPPRMGRSEGSRETLGESTLPWITDTGRISETGTSPLPTTSNTRLTVTEEVSRRAVWLAALLALAALLFGAAMLLRLVTS